MVKMVAIAAAAVALFSQEGELPPIPREFRAAWVATVDNIDWPSKNNLTTEQQQAELRTLITKAKAMKLNALVLQVRPSADAMYPSKLEPWSEFLTGQTGRAPNPWWDPLEYAVQQCHKAGIELHCWFNPYRAVHTVQKGPVSSDHIARANPEVVKTYAGYRWMDPGEPLVQKRSLEVMFDVVERYDIDGIHIDDYFYPYPIYDGNKQKIEFPDGPSFSRYQSGGGKLTRADWRRQNVDNFIKDLHDGIKKRKSYVKFGISPFGIARPGVPSGIVAGIDQYNDLFADAEKWLQLGWCDYYSPQLYWAIDKAPQSYPKLLKYWISVNPFERHIWPGLYTSRTDPGADNWKASEIVNQVRLSRELQSTAGNVHFSFKSLQKNWNNVASTLSGSTYASDAFVPESPWLDDEQPAKAKVSTSGPLSFESEENLPMAVSYQSASGTWGPWQRYTSGTPIPKKPVACVVFSRTGIESNAVIAK